jgi:hypothetical protein
MVVVDNFAPGRPEFGELNLQIRVERTTSSVANGSHPSILVHVYGADKGRSALTFTTSHPWTIAERPCGRLALQRCAPSAHIRFAERRE